ncbi:hypothetical protein FOL47_001327 [Perkinsus chesapeaki]|uniref:Uncharacterized protein n=1 Tax=Perkinsus chesapeaki TaxID=330153 RepID=A0A7J6MKJ6_PERCH|nr:hypothetical protein FOL47_001327 [Perkinsus chesapeaki]
MWTIPAFARFRRDLGGESLSWLVLEVAVTAVRDVILVALEVLGDSMQAALFLLVKAYMSDVHRDYWKGLGEAIRRSEMVGAAAAAGIPCRGHVRVAADAARGFL